VSPSKDLPTWGGGTIPVVAVGVMTAQPNPVFPLNPVLGAPGSQILVSRIVYAGDNKIQQSGSGTYFVLPGLIGVVYIGFKNSDGTSFSSEEYSFVINSNNHEVQFICTKLTLSASASSAKPSILGVGRKQSE
jgi:hypothetical protein